MCSSDLHLGTSDAGVITLRRRLLNSVRNFQQGQEPPEPRKATAYRVCPIADIAYRNLSLDEVLGSGDLDLARSEVG